MKDINFEEVKRELEDNKSNFLVSLLDFADQIKNQTHDNQYRLRINTIIADLNSLRKDMINSSPEVMKQLDIVINDLGWLKTETQCKTHIDGKDIFIDYHKVGIEYLKKRIHCDVNNMIRRMYLILGVPLEKRKIDKFKE